MDICGSHKGFKYECFDDLWGLLVGLFRVHHSSSTFASMAQGKIVVRGMAPGGIYICIPTLKNLEKWTCKASALVPVRLRASQVALPEVQACNMFCLGELCFYQWDKLLYRGCVGIVGNRISLCKKALVPRPVQSEPQSEVSEGLSGPSSDPRSSYLGKLLTARNAAPSPACFSNTRRPNLLAGDFGACCAVAI